jgi:hypothetical protein
MEILFIFMRNVRRHHHLFGSSMSVDASFPRRFCQGLINALGHGFSAVVSNTLNLTPATREKAVTMKYLNNHNDKISGEPRL